MEQVKKDGTVPLILDSGNLFFSQSPIPADIKAQMILKADVIAEAYKKIGIDVLNVGELDLALGINYLMDKKRTLNLPFVSSNIVYTDNERTVFQPFIIREMNGLKIAVFGLLPVISSESIVDLKILPPAETASKMVGRLRKKADIVILLSNLGQNEDEKLARDLPGIDIIVGGRNRALLQTPVRVGETMILQAQAQGKNIGRLDFNLADRSYVNAITPMDDKVSKNEEIEGMLKRYKDAIVALHSVKGKPVPQAVSLGSYIGEAACAACHHRQIDFWKGTRHARAYDTLVKRNNHADLECVGCHTTGYGLPGGFSLGMETPGLRNVQCEACHGPGREHKGRGDIRRVMEVSICRGCHDTEKDPSFNIVSSINRVRCPK